MKTQYTLTKTFGVEATDSQGHIVRLSLNAPSESIVRQHVQRQGLSPQQIYELPQSLKNTSTIRAISQGVELALPRRMTGQSEQSPFTWVMGWIAVGLVSLFLLASSIQRGFNSLVWGIWGTTWGVGGLILLYRLANAVVGREKIRISRERLKIGHYLGGMGTAKTYTIPNITNVRVAPQGNGLLFDYNGDTIHFGKSLSVAEANTLCKNIVDMLTFHCQSVKHILFGTFAFRKHDDQYLVLSNPDVAELEFPFAHLSQVTIEVDTYNFHLVERFLTYAVNIIGQEYLKRAVDVHIYGDEHKLHPNLRNNFTNLCKRVYIHEEI